MTDHQANNSQLADAPEETRIFQQEQLLVEVTMLMCKVMSERGVTRKQLAERLGKTPGRISQILNGETNLTLRTIADVFSALDVKPSFSTGDIKASSANLPILHCLDTVVDLSASKGSEGPWEFPPSAFDPYDFKMAG